LISQERPSFRQTGSFVTPGNTIGLQVWVQGGLLRPAWAALCGALASGGLTLSAQPLLRLALLGFLVDVLWGGLWAALITIDWATPLRQWKDWHRGTPVNLLPYTSPQGPAGRLARTWGHLKSWWQTALKPTAGPTIVGLILLLPLVLVSAGLLGSGPLLLTLAALALLQLTFALQGDDGGAASFSRGLFQAALPWLAGHVLFAPLAWPSVLLALAYGLTWAGGVRLSQGRAGLATWNLGQALALIVLLAVRQPLLAGIAALLWLGQAVAQPALFDAQTGNLDSAAAGRFLHFAQFWLMAAMFLAAVGVRLASQGG
jgi:hypothetical protein